MKLNDRFLLTTFKFFLICTYPYVQSKDNYFFRLVPFQASVYLLSQNILRESKQPLSKKKKGIIGTKYAYCFIFGFSQTAHLESRGSVHNEKEELQKVEKKWRDSGQDILLQHSHPSCFGDGNRFLGNELSMRRMTKYHLKRTVWLRTSVIIRACIFLYS